MTVVPWRVKKVLSVRFPLLYHLAVNLGTKGNSPEHWDAWLAKTWDGPGRNWPSLNDLVASLTQPADVILDVGCGTGSMLRSLKKRGYRNLHGMDTSAYAVTRLRAEGMNIHRGELPAIPLPALSYDVVIASFVLEHLLRRRLFLREVVRVLKPAGSAFIFVPDNCLSPLDEPEHVTVYTERSLRRFLERHVQVTSIARVRDIDNPIPILFAQLRKPAPRSRS